MFRTLFFDPILKDYFSVLWGIAVRLFAVELIYGRIYVVLLNVLSPYVQGKLLRERIPPLACAISSTEPGDQESRLCFWPALANLPVSL